MAEIPKMKQISAKEALKHVASSLPVDDLDNLFYCRVIDAEIDALTAELRALREAVRWIPVSERLPEERMDVLGVLEDGTRVVCDYAPNCACNAKWHGSNREVPTHWQPLPAPPTAEGSRG